MGSRDPAISGQPLSARSLPRETCLGPLHERAIDVRHELTDRELAFLRSARLTCVLVVGRDPEWVSAAGGSPRSTRGRGRCSFSSGVHKMHFCAVTPGSSYDTVLDLYEFNRQL